MSCAGCDQLRNELATLAEESRQLTKDVLADLTTARATITELRAELDRGDAEVRRLLGTSLQLQAARTKLDEVTTRLQHEQADAEQYAAYATRQIALLEHIQRAVRAYFDAYSDHEKDEALVGLRDLVPAERYCEFCAIGLHTVDDCNLLKHMKGVRFDKETRQVMWSICTRHDYWSSNSHAECEPCKLEVQL